MKKKRCPQCEKTKAINEFSKDSSKPDGYKGLCKNCKNKRARERAEKRKSGEIAYIKRDKKRCTKCGKQKLLHGFSKKSGSKYGHNSKCKSCDRQYHKELREKRKTGKIAYIKRAEKRCSQCGKTRPIVEFNKNTVSPDGHNARCKKCVRKNIKERIEKLKSGEIPHIKRGKKRCKQCGKTKQINDFGKRIATKDGHQSQCKKCINAYRRALYAKDPEKNREYSKAWYVKNRENVNAKQRTRYAKNPEKYREYNKKYREKYLEKLRRRWAEKAKARRAKNPEKYRSDQRLWRAKNREKINKRKRELYQEQQKSELFENIMKVGKIVNEIFC